MRLRPDPCPHNCRRLALSSRIISALPVIAAAIVLLSALGIVATTLPGRAAYLVAGVQQPDLPRTGCPVSEDGGGVASTPKRSRRLL